jgi:restriction system protein
MLKERDAGKRQKIHAKTALQELVRHARDSSTKAEVLVQAVIKLSLKSNEGDLVRAIISPWRAIVELLKDDWNQAYQISPRTWEELIAGAFDQDGYDEVILTPRSGDFGRDVVATKHGVGSVRIIDSVKAFRPDRLVRQDDVRALLGVLYGDPRASKAIITTTSDFAPGITSDPYLAPSMPTRLELMNGVQLRDWMTKLSEA